jgi:hypothetical protein
MTDTAYRVRGRARHGDVAGWIRQADVLSADPNLADNLKKLFERTQKVEELIQNRQVALGMTSSRGPGIPRQAHPQEHQNQCRRARKKNSSTASLKECRRPPPGRDAFGQLVQTVIYVKVEVGTLSVSFKDGVVSEIEETKGNPLGAGGVQIVPPPLVF